MRRQLRVRPTVLLLLGLFFLAGLQTAQAILMTTAYQEEYERGTADEAMHGVLWDLQTKVSALERERK